MTTALHLLDSAFGVLGQTVPRPSPSSAGMPGGSQLNQVLNWVFWCALVGCIGVATWGGFKFAISSRRGSAVGVNDGKTMAIAGVLGAAICYLAPDAAAWAIRWLGTAF